MYLVKVMLLSALTAKAPLSFFEPVFKELKRKIIVIEKETTISVQTRIQNHVIEIGNSFVISYKIELIKLSSTKSFSFVSVAATIFPMMGI